MSFSPTSIPAVTDPGLAHARDLRAARDRQLALIAMAAALAAARRPPAAPVAVLPRVPAPEPAPATETVCAETQRRRAQIRRLGICLPVDPDAPSMVLGKPAETAP